MSDHILDELSELKKKNALQSIEAISKAKERLNSLEAVNTKFPIEVFPEEIQKIIKEYHQCYKFPVDYYGLSVMVAASTVLGNAFSAYYKRDFHTVPMIYGIIVGNSGVGKSKAINQMLYPVHLIQEEYIENYETLLTIWKDFYREFGIDCLQRI